MSASRARVALVGCGSIATQHAIACRVAGHSVEGVCGRPGSGHVAAFAEAQGIPRSFSSLTDLLRERERFDAAIVAVPVGETPAALAAVADAGLPVLVEKPGAEHSADLARFLERSDRIMVGYNRRFYRTVRAARDFARENGPVQALLQLPERVMQHPREAFFANTVHALDIGRFVLGDITITSVERLGGGSGGLAAIGHGRDGSLVQLQASFNTPANFALTLDGGGRRFELKPFESAAIYDELRVREPTPDHPVREYAPHVAESIALDPADREAKPGFVAQARALGELAAGHPVDDAARIADAIAALRLVEQLVADL